MTTRISPAAVPEAFAAAWNEHDAAALAAVFHDDADFTNVFGMRATGRDAIHHFHAPILATMFRDSRLQVTATHVRLLASGVAAVDAFWQMSGAVGPGGEPWDDRRGLMVLVCTEQDGRWGIAVMHNMDLPDESLAAAQAAVQRDGVLDAGAGPAD